MRPWEIDRMTFNELYYFTVGEEERVLTMYRAVRMGAYSVLRTKTKRKLKPRHLYELPGDDRKKDSPRCGISKKQEKKLAEKYDPVYLKWKAKQHDRRA